jgi:hypothetical protein
MLTENQDISHVIKRHRASEKTIKRTFKAAIGNIEFTILGKKATNPISVAYLNTPRMCTNSERKR